MIDRQLFHGAIAFDEKDGYIIPLRFTDKQIGALSENEFFQKRARCGTSVSIRLATEARRLSFAYKFFFRSGVKSSFEIYTNGRLTHLIHDDELEDEGVLSFSLETGTKPIEIYVPHYSEVGIKNFSIDDKYAEVPSKATGVLFIGDSITQGYGSRSSAQTFANIASREMDYEILNQGIGGYGFDPTIVQDLPFTPDKIIVALGTNHYHTWTEDATRASIEAFFERLSEKYQGIKTLVILPPYTGREREEHGRAVYAFIRRTIAETAATYPSVQLVSAYTMIPHAADYFEEDFLHPNPRGMAAYGNALVQELKKIDF